LHQLRGRVGRGADQSYCILIASGPPEAFARLRILSRTQDGFEIAREDLRLRGMGDFFGARQHGWPEFRFFDPERDDDLLTQARERATATVGRDPDLASPGNAPLRAVIETRYGEKERLSGVG
jgi:ATP-dependent DNA helicase RecG